jgi:hypothetical protein
MESSLRGHAATFQQHQQLQMQNQQYLQQQQHRRRNYGGGTSHSQSQDYMSVGSHFSRDSVASTTSGASSQVDEAYRRLGRRLSARAHGDGPITQPQRLSRIGMTPSSTFTPFQAKSTTFSTNKEPNDVSSVSLYTRDTLKNSASFSFHCLLILVQFIPLYRLSFSP